MEVNFFLFLLIQDFFPPSSQYSMAEYTSFSFIYWSIDFLLILKKIFIGDTKKKNL